MKEEKPNTNAAKLELEVQSQKLNWAWLIVLLPVLLVLGLVAACYLDLPSDPQNQHAQTKENGDEGSGGDSIIPPRIDFGPAQLQPDTAKEEKESGDCPCCYLKQAFSAERFADWILVLGGLAGIFIGVSTLQHLRRQTTELIRQTAEMSQQTSASIVSADAAKKSADAAHQGMILSYRSYVFLDEWADPPIVRQRTLLIQHKRVIVSVNIVNRGQIPCTIEHISWRCHGAGVREQTTTLAYDLMVFPSEPREQEFVIDLLPEAEAATIIIIGHVRYRDEFVCRERHFHRGISYDPHFVPPISLFIPEGSLNNEKECQPTITGRLKEILGDKPGLS